MECHVNISDDAMIDLAGQEFNLLLKVIGWWFDRKKLFFWLWWVQSISTQNYSFHWNREHFVFEFRRALADKRNKNCKLHAKLLLCIKSNSPRRDSLSLVKAFWLELLWTFKIQIAVEIVEYSKQRQVVKATNFLQFHNRFEQIGLAAPDKCQ